MWVSYKRTFHNFGCRGSSEAEPRLWESQLLCHCRKGTKPWAQSFSIPIVIVALTSPKTFLLFFFFFVCLSPLFCSTENCTNSSSVAPRLAMVTHSCAAWLRSFLTNCREQHHQRGCRNNQRVSKRLTCPHLPREKTFHQFQWIALNTLLLTNTKKQEYHISQTETLHSAFLN